MANGTINVGIVGACGRGASFRTACEASGLLTIHAVCDTWEEKLEEAKTRLGAVEQYADYGEMLNSSDIQAVILGTPMDLHVPQAIEALKLGKHVLCEVPAGISIDQCRELVRAARASKGVYMMAENYCYMLPNVLVRELVKAGLFGRPYYAEGEYIHELKDRNELTPWRRKWQTGINGVTYGTHSLGPILQWMEGDRVSRVCCAGGGRRYTDPRGDEYENEASCVMLCQTERGALIKIRVDMLSDRPHAMTNYQLQGTDGCYESARSAQEANRIWLRSKCKDMDTWMDLAGLEVDYLPEFWLNASKEAKAAGHGGGDYFEIIDFAEAALGRRPCPIDVDRAMDFTLPGLVSQQSIEEGGAWLEVPDSRDWQL